MPFLKPTVILDLDNTLVECGKYYDQAKWAGAHYVEQSVGMPAAIARDLLEHIDTAAIRATHDFTRARLPNSFAALAETARRLVGRRGPEMFVEELYALGDAVFDAPYDLLPHTAESLERLAAAGYQLVMLTKGDPNVQYKKIKLHECLQRPFRTHYIVPAKGTEALLDILKREDVDLEISWSVGDSYRDDIAPAIELGLNTALVTAGTGHGGYDQTRNVGEPTLERRYLHEVVDNLLWRLKSVPA